MADDILLLNTVVTTTNGKVIFTAGDSRVVIPPLSIKGKLLDATIRFTARPFLPPSAVKNNWTCIQDLRLILIYGSPKKSIDLTESAIKFLTTSLDGPDQLKHRNNYRESMLSWLEYASKWKDTTWFDRSDDEQTIQKNAAIPKLGNLLHPMGDGKDYFSIVHYLYESLDVPPLRLRDLLQQSGADPGVILAEQCALIFSIGADAPYSQRSVGERFQGSLHYSVEWYYQNELADLVAQKMRQILIKLIETKKGIGSTKDMLDKANSRFDDIEGELKTMEQRLMALNTIATSINQKIP